LRGGENSKWKNPFVSTPIIPVQPPLGSPIAERVLQFADLSKRHVGVSDGISASYAEAVRVCLDRHHVSPAKFEMRNNSTKDVATAQWSKVDLRISNAWANRDDATEAGAYGLALAAIEIMRGLVAVRRAETRTGADYYLGPVGSSMDDLETS
jgi:hypothetical protein